MSFIESLSLSSLFEFGSVVEMVMVRFTDSRGLISARSKAQAQEFPMRWLSEDFMGKITQVIVAVNPTEPGSFENNATALTVRNNLPSN